MTYIIAEPCIDIKDRSCVDVCPVDCIHEYERILVIDPEECINPSAPSRRSSRPHRATPTSSAKRACTSGSAVFSAIMSDWK